MVYLTWLGKLGLAVFWITLALALGWSTPVARPFAGLLATLVVLIVLLHLWIAVRLDATSRLRPAPWLERLQLLLFGAFQQQLITGQAVRPESQVELSEKRAGSGQTDQAQPD